jgi:hypothetical protein
MSLSFIFSFYLLVHLSLMVFSFRINSHSWRIWLLRALLFGMMYDNSMLLLSSMFGVPDWLKLLNYPRWVLHAGILPFLTLLTLSFLREAKIAVADKKWLANIFIAITVICLIYGIWAEVFLLDVGVKAFADSTGTFAAMERFTSLSTLPPFATIFTSLFMLPWAAVIWRATGWPWFFLGSLAIFIINGATGSLPCGFLAGNFAEIIFITALLYTERYFSRRRGE